LLVRVREQLVGLFANPVEHAALQALALSPESIALFTGLKTDSAHLLVEFLALGGGFVLEAEGLELRTLDGVFASFEKSDHRTKNQRTEDEKSDPEQQELNPDRPVEVDDGALRKKGCG
jgi:hypothetical protein